jgi:hypothetical protein
MENLEVSAAFLLAFLLAFFFDFTARLIFLVFVGLDF